MTSLIAAFVIGGLLFLAFAWLIGRNSLLSQQLATTQEAASEAVGLRQRVTLAESIVARWVSGPITVQLSDEQIHHIASTIAENVKNVTFYGSKVN